MSKPIHIDKQELFCNRCLGYVNKWTQTNIVLDEVYCLLCGNWLAGEYDCFGDTENCESPAILRIKAINGLMDKKIFLSQFLRIIYRKLNSSLPDSDYEKKLIVKACDILGEETRHIASVI